MVEDIPVIPNVQKPAVGVAKIVSGVIFVLISVKVQVTKVNEHAAILKITIRPVTHCITEIVVML